MAPGFLSGLQSLSLNPAASSSAGNGATFVGPGGGGWTVNVGGSGVAFQGQTNAMALAALAAAVLGAVWLLTRK